MNKSTAHGLIKKSAWMMERLEKVLKDTMLKDDYLCMDESYYNPDQREKQTGLRRSQRLYLGCLS